jgi:hypothetical protein
MYSTQAPVAVLRPRVQVSTWALPAQGTRMPFPAAKLHGLAVPTIVISTATVSAAQGATNGATKDAQGDEAFEDPV